MSDVTELASHPYTVKNLPVAPVPAVDVASPSTSLSDRNLERAHDERLGVPSSWLLGPDAPGTVEVPELDGSGYHRPVASAQGDQEITVSRPFPVTVSPARLLDGLRPRG